MPYHHPCFTDIDTKPRAKTITSLSKKLQTQGWVQVSLIQKPEPRIIARDASKLSLRDENAGGLRLSSTSGSLKTFNDISKWWLTGPLMTTTCLLSLAHLTPESEKAEKMHKEWTEPVEANPLGGGAEGKEWTWPKFTVKPFTTTIFTEVSQTSILELSILRIRQIKWIAQKHSTKEPDASHPRLLDSALNPYT